MQPLKARERANSPIEAAAIELLRSAEPYHPPAGLKQRVRARLLATRAVRGVPHVRALRPALLAGCVLIAAGASAAIGAKWILDELTGASHLHRNAQLRAPPAQGASADHSGHTSSAMPGAASAPTAPAPLSELKSDSVTRLEDLPMAPSAPSAPRHAEATPTSRPEANAEQELVFEAMRALRREGQPGRAAHLLDDYLRRYPHGSLCEEALALAIEANSALGDPRTRTLAESYLASYPAGRFRPAAIRARTRFSQ